MAEQEDEAFVAFVPHPGTPPPQGRAGVAVADPAGNDTPEARRHDATQLPSSFDARAREADALGRIERWHGPGEWQAAMLALALMPLEPPTADALDAEANPDSRRRAWQAATADLSVAAAVRREIEALGAPARRQVLAALLQRAGKAAWLQRRQARQALMQRWRSSGSLRACTQWRALAIGLSLGVRRPVTPRAGAPASLIRHAAAAHAATRQLAAVLGATADASHAWHNAATQALAELGAAAPRGPAAGLAPATVLRDLHLALRVRHLAPMQRPLLLRAWLLAAEPSGLADHVGTADALHLACLVLDVPVPESLTTSPHRLPG